MDIASSLPIYVDSVGRERTKQFHGIGAKFVPNWEQNMLYTKS